MRIGSSVGTELVEFAPAHCGGGHSSVSLDHLMLCELAVTVKYAVLSAGQANFLRVI